VLVGLLLDDALVRTVGDAATAVLVALLLEDEVVVVSTSVEVGPGVGV